MSPRALVSWPRSIATRLALASTLAMLVTLGVPGFVLVSAGIRLQRTSATRALGESAGKASLLISTFVNRVTVYLGLLEQGLVLGGDATTHLRGGLVAQGSPLSALTLLDPEGHELARVSRFHSYLPEELGAHSASPAFAAVRDDAHYAGPIFVSPESGLLSMEVAIAVGPEAARGVLVAEANLTLLWREVAGIAVGATGYAYLVDRSGRLVAYQDQSEVLRRHGESLLGRPPVAAFVAGQGTAGAAEYTGLTGERVLGVAQPIPGTDWAVVVEQPVAEALRDSRRMSGFFLGLVLLGTGAAIVVAYVAARRILRPVRAVTETARRIGRGELDAPVLEVAGLDEVAALASAFRTMQKELHTLYGDLEGRVRQLTEAELALRASEEGYRTLFENSGSAMAILDEEATLVMVNKQFTRLSGCAKEEVERKRIWLDFVVPESRAAILARHRRRRAEADFRPETYEFPFLAGDGTIHPALVTVVLLPDGKRSLTALVDVAELRAAERAQLESERKFRAVFDEAFQLVGLIDLAGRLVEANQTALDVIGAPRADVVGRPFWETRFFAHSAEVAGQIRDAVERALAGELMRFSTTCSSAIPGVLLTLDVSLKPVRSAAGAVSLLIAEGRDITEIRRSEVERERLQEQLRQAQKMESIGRLAGGVAHDFNNLLTVIFGNIDVVLLGRSTEDPDRAGLVAVREAAASAARLTAQLLAFSRKQIIEPRVLDLNEHVAAVLKMLGRLIGENIELRFLRCPSPCRVHVDPGQIEQIVVNLAVNARDAMPEGGRLSIELSCTRLDAEYCRLHPWAAPGEYVVLAVADSGVGMSEETLAHIFEPFFTTKAGGHGTGLGLATTYGAVHQNAGGIEVYSELGKGSVFRVYLPRAGDAPARPAAGAAGAATGAETILLVEDNVHILASSTRILRHLGYVVLTAPSAEAAIEVEAAHPGPIDLLFTDVVLPGMNGQQLATTLKKRRAAMHVLYTSGYTDNAIVAHGVLAEELAFIQKPYSLEAIAAKLREVLDKHG